jgi:hypothetical protein
MRLMSYHAHFVGLPPQVMAQSPIDKIPRGSKLNAITAEKVFGWKPFKIAQTSLPDRDAQLNQLLSPPV